MGMYCVATSECGMMLLASLFMTITGLFENLNMPTAVRFNIFRHLPKLSVTWKDLYFLNIDALKIL